MLKQVSGLGCLVWRALLFGVGYGDGIPKKFSFSSFSFNSNTKFLCLRRAPGACRNQLKAIEDLRFYKVARGDYARVTGYSLGARVFYFTQ